MNDTRTREERKEIDILIEMLRASPFPADLDGARAAMDDIGTPVAEDISVERMQKGGVECQLLTPPGADRGRLILYLHGGAYALGSLESHAGLAAEIGRAANCAVLQVDYRLAPEHQFPAPVEDVCSVFRRLLKEGHNPAKLVLAGDSAGGGLVIATIYALKQANEPLPGAGVCLSPWVDMEFTGDSIESCRELDPIIDMEVIRSLVEIYLGTGRPDDPLASPLNAELEGFPPLLIQVGEREVLLSDAERLAEKARKAKLDVVFERWPEMIHVWHLFYPQLGEGRTAIARIGDFIRDKII